MRLRYTALLYFQSEDVWGESSGLDYAQQTLSSLSGLGHAKPKIMQSLWNKKKNPTFDSMVCIIYFYIDEEWEMRIPKTETKLSIEIWDAEWCYKAKGPN